MDAQKKYILIGEDDKFFAKVYLLKLSKAGYDVSVVESGDQVIAQATVRKPDLIMLDLIMPKKDGFQTLQELKANPNLRTVKVLITSALEQPEDIQKVKQLGAAGFLNKSSIQNIVTEVQKYVE
jgi:two-component system, OmpR family, alkaline phosphatase synthesis response regulator PhoP